jgi:hypothetical protein
MSKYFSWPERLYVIHRNKILFLSGPGPFFYDIEELGRFLATL